MDGELPLPPYRVLDLTLEEGHLCGRMLADVGADVIKVEPPGGDPARKRGPFYQRVPHPERSFHFWFYNLNKRGVTLDVAKPEGQVLLRRLVRSADVLVESYAPGYLNSLGLGPDTLRQLNRNLIVTSITPFGGMGPRARFAAPDIVVQAMGGLMYVTGDQDRPPLRITPPQAYLHAASEAAVGTLHALVARRVINEGQNVETSAQQAVIWALMNATVTWDLNQINITREGALRGSVSLAKRRLNWPCKDGYVTVSIAGGASAASQGTVRGIIQWMEDEGIAPDFLLHYDFAHADWRTMPQAEYDTITAPIAAFFKTKTKKELFQGALKRRIILYPVSTMADLAVEEQLLAREYYVKVWHPELETHIVYPGPAQVISGQRLPVRRRPPLIGEHNAEVYCGELGLGEVELAGLRQKKVV